MVLREQSSQTDEPSVGSRRFMGFKLENTLKFLSSLLLPMAVGVFTSVLTIQQQRSSEKQREADREASTRQLEQERNLTSERYKNEIFKDYVDAISQLLKESNGSLTADKTTANIARIKTLNVFRQLDGDRNVQIIRFLHEAGQLNSTNVERTLDLSTAELYHVNFRDAAVNKKKLDFLFLNNAFLYNVTFGELELKENNFANTEFHLASFRFSQMKAMEFISATINNTDFTYATLENMDFENAQFNNTEFSSATLNMAHFHTANISNANFSRTIMENMDFTNAQINNTAFNNATFRIANFSSGVLQNINFQFAQFIGPVSPNDQISILANFSSTTLRNADFSFAYISRGIFESSTLENVNFSFSELFNVDFSRSKRIFKLDFSNALLYNVILPKGVSMEHIDFSYSRLVGMTAGDKRSTNTDFSFANLTDADLSSSELPKANFSSSILRRVTFYQAEMPNTDLSLTTCITGDFQNANLSHSNFENANLKHASFINAKLANASFHGANLYRVNFRNSNISDDQLRTAFSIQDIVLPNGTFIKENNLIRNGEALCNVSVTGDWTLVNGTINTSMSNSNKDDCQFHLQSHATGATMSQRMNLFGKWDSISWPYSKAVLTAHMNMNVTLVLKGLDSTGRVVLQTTLTKSNDTIDIVLQNAMTELEVVIQFYPVINQTNNNATWCDNVRLFIIYGTYKELIRVIPNLPVNARWEQQSVTVAGGKGDGENNNQLYWPLGLFVDDDDDQTIFIDDWGNHRIMQWKRGDTQGRVVAGGNGKGNRLDQLDTPTDVLFDQGTNSLIIADRWNNRVVLWSRRSGTTQGEIIIDDISCYGLAMDEQRNLYVSDYNKNEVRRYEIDRRDKNGTMVAGGNGEGSDLNQLNWPLYLFVDRNQSLYVSDYENHRVMKWDKSAAQGVVVAGGQGKGSALTQLSHPTGIFVDTLGTLYVAEGGNDRVTRWPQGSEKKGTVVVSGNGRGSTANQLNDPHGFSFDKHGNLYVVDHANHRVQRFNVIK